MAVPPVSADVFAAASLLCFIGHESPVQQSQFSHEAVDVDVDVDEAFFIFIGHESWLMDAFSVSFIFMGHESAPFGQHDILVFMAVLAYANTATPTPSDKTVNTVNKIFFFILFPQKFSFLSGCRTKRVRREIDARGAAL